MKIFRSSIPSGKPLEIDEDFDLSNLDYSKSYPLLGIKSCHCCGLFEKNGKDNIITFNGRIDAVVTLSDARTLEPFDQEVVVDDVFDLLEDAEQDGDGYIFPGNGIIVEDVLFAAIRSETPIKPLKGDSALPENTDEISFFVEGEEEKSSPFDVLDNYDFGEEEK